MSYPDFDEDCYGCAVACCGVVGLAVLIALGIWIGRRVRAELPRCVEHQGSWVPPVGTKSCVVL